MRLTTDVTAPIEFTQYLMPAGRPDTVWIDRPIEIADKAKAIVAAGYRFECEMLSDYRTVSLTITSDDEGDVEIEVVKNGPDVPIAVDRMIDRFHNTLAGREALAIVAANNGGE